MEMYAQKPIFLIPIHHSNFIWIFSNWGYYYTSQFNLGGKGENPPSCLFSAQNNPKFLYPPKWAAVLWKQLLYPSTNFKRTWYRKWVRFQTNFTMYGMDSSCKSREGIPGSSDPTLRVAWLMFPRPVMLLLASSRSLLSSRNRYRTTKLRYGTSVAHCCHTPWFQSHQWNMWLRPSIRHSHPKTKRVTSPQWESIAHYRDQSWYDRSYTINKHSKRNYKR